MNWFPFSPGSFLESRRGSFSAERRRFSKLERPGGVYRNDAAARNAGLTPEERLRANHEPDPHLRTLRRELVRPPDGATAPRSGTDRQSCGVDAVEPP